MKRQEPLEVVFFESEAGSQPVKEFLTGRPREDRKEIGGDIYKVQEGVSGRITSRQKRGHRFMGSTEYYP
ncbi:MAG: hypothetical protein LBK13_10250 [Spirochaetales bacterium]|nr:hypothetical protein [Spirochaetales bacterium]